MSRMDVATQQNFMIRPGRVEQLADDYDVSLAVWVYDEPTLYDDLVFAGYPLTNDPAMGGYYIDLAVDPASPGDVVVFTTGLEPREHHMGRAGGLFTAWHRRNVTDD